MTISVSEIQWLQIANAAEALSPADRESFVTHIVRELEGKPIGEGTVARAVATSFKVFFIPPEFRAYRRAGRGAKADLHGLLGGDAAPAAPRAVGVALSRPRRLHGVLASP